MKKSIAIILSLSLIFTAFTAEDCNHDHAISSSGISKANTTVTADLSGHSIEQNNIISRLQTDNKPGSIKHLYVISPYSGQVILYSTVKGKVTSGNKRLSPSMASTYQSSGDFRIDLPNTRGQEDFYYTNEVIGDDGVYGSSSEYIFWYDVRGTFHQHFLTGGQIVHVAEAPLTVRDVIINVETNQVNSPKTPLK
jgi:hypothetical protein